MHEIGDKAVLIDTGDVGDPEPLVAAGEGEVTAPTYAVDEATLAYHIMQLKLAGKGLNIASAVRGGVAYAQWAHAAVAAAGVLISILEGQNPASPHLERLREEGYLN